MMTEETWASLTLQQQAVINGRHVFLYLVSSGIGNIFVLQHEDKGLLLYTKLYFNDLDKAERDFSKTCKLILDGRT